MIKTKKFTAFLLAAVMTFATAVTSFAALPSDVVDSKYEEAIETLGALKIMVGDAETGLFRPEESLKRSEFAKVAVELLGLGGMAANSAKPTSFPDVVENHWANGYINIAADQGIVIGDDEGNFRPDDTISYAEAMTMLVRAAGFEPSAESKGGFPTGYIVVGSQNGISKNAEAGANDAVLRGMVAQMTFNTLTVKMMEQVGFGGNANYEIVDKTILEDILNVTKQTGQITAIGTSSLSGTSSLKDNEVKINDTVYEVEESALAATRNLLGFNVVYYVKTEGSDEELILARPESNKNSYVKITADNVESVEEENDGITVNYWLDKENDKETEEAEVSKEVKLIYNGKPTNFSKELLMPEAGRIVLLDIDRDDVYDIVFVTSYENYVVEEVIATSNRITDKYGKTSLVLDKKDTNVKFLITRGEQTLEITDLNEWDVLSVAKSLDNKIINIEVTTNSISGKVTEVREDKRYIGGEEYKIASNYPDEIKLNDEGTFYLDAEGKIAAVDKSTSLSSNYAYLVNAELSTGFDKNLQVKLFTKEGETKVLTSGEKIKLNGTSGKKPSEVLSELKNSNGEVVSQLITFETNANGVLTQLNTAEDRTSTGEINKNKFTQNAAGSFEYKTASKKLGAYNVNENTVVFDIPDGETDTDKFSIETMALFEDKTSYDVSIFDLGEDMTAKAIIVTNSNGTANLDAPLAIIDSITETINSNGDTVQKVYVFENGEKTSYFTDEDDVLTDTDGTKLKKGDIVQLKTNAKNEIESVRVLFKASDKNTESINVIDDDLCTVYGKVVKKFADSINVSVNDGAVSNYSIDGVTVYEYDSSKAKNSIKVVQPGDIAQYDELDAQRVFIKLYKDAVCEIVIVK